MNPSATGDTTVQGPDAPSPWIERFAPLIAPGGEVLDLAAGGGRHARFLLARGHPVVAVDRDISQLTGCRHPLLGVLEADLEAGAWPFPDRRFAGVVVTNYLHRPLLAKIVAAVAPGGVLLYETFAVGNERHGRPANPDFLLREGELLEAVAGRLTVVAYEHGFSCRPRPCVRQRIAAVAAALAGAAAGG
jgi:SAM-dependent methyltransferase